MMFTTQRHIIIVRSDTKTAGNGSELRHGSGNLYYINTTL